MTNEKLIEEAARAIAAFTDPEAWTAFRGEAEAALAVFEKVHTPTDADEVISEREALRELLGPILHKPLSDIVDAVIGFRRTEVPEPSAEGDEFAQDECDGSGTCPALRHIHGCYTRHRADQCDSPDEYGHLPPARQCEPSDAQVEAARDAYYAEWGPHEAKIRAALRAANEVR